MFGQFNIFLNKILPHFNPDEACVPYSFPANSGDDVYNLYEKKLPQYHKMDKKLTFHPIQIRTRGKYKVCYCDQASSTGCNARKKKKNMEKKKRQMKKDNEK